jgi:hypothetical protein
MPIDVMAAPPPPRQSRDLTYEFIDKYYMKQPKPVRTATFIVFVFLFAYAFVKLIGGEVVFSGTMIEPSGPNQWSLAKNYDISAGVDRLVGTNSKGEYHLIVGNAEAVALLARGTLKVRVTDKEGHVRTGRDGKTVSVDRLSMSLEPLPLDPEPEPQTVAHTGSRPQFGLLPVVHAAALAGNRLFIRQLTSKNGGSVTLRCVNGCSVAGQPLRASRAGGADAGPIPVVAGRTIAYDFDYYFEVPIDSDGVDIAVAPVSKSWFGREEHFVLGRSPGRLPEVGEELRYGGTIGSRLVVLMLSPDDVIVYAKDDIAAKLPQLKSALRSAGLGYVEQSAPLGDTSQTNALFVGSAVSVENAQKALRVAQQLDIRVKTVRKRDPKSTNQHQIQLSGVAALNGTSALAPSVTQQLLSAKSDREFWAVNQTPPARPPVTRAVSRAGPR